jgi:hypothetical protein
MFERDRSLPQEEAGVRGCVKKARRHDLAISDHKLLNCRRNNFAPQCITSYGALEGAANSQET